MAKNPFTAFKEGWRDGMDRNALSTQKKHLKRAMRRSRGPILNTTCNHYELDALLAGGWKLQDTFSVGAGSPRYALTRPRP